MTSYELVGRITIKLHDVPVEAALLHDVHFLRRRKRLLIQLCSSLEEVILCAIGVRGKAKHLEASIRSGPAGS